MKKKEQLYTIWERFYPEDGQPIVRDCGPPVPIGDATAKLHDWRYLDFFFEVGLADYWMVPV